MKLIFLALISSFLFVCCEEPRPLSYEEMFEDQIEFTFPSSPPEQDQITNLALVDRFMRERRLGYYSGGGGSAEGEATAVRVRFNSTAMSAEDIKKYLVEEGLLPADAVFAKVD